MKTDKEKTARRAQKARFKAKHPDLVKAREKARKARWKANHPEQAKERELRKYLRRAHRISLEEYRNMVAAQGGLCAGCERPPKDGERLCVDHNHKTKAIRGLLCHNCNRGIGFLGEDPNTFARLVKYLKGRLPKAQGCLLRVVK